MTGYQIVVEVSPLEKGKPESTHIFNVELDEENFWRVRADQSSERDEILRQEIEEMACAILLSRNLLPPSRMIASGRPLEVVLVTQRRIPDMTETGISLWYLGTHRCLSLQSRTNGHSLGAGLLLHS